LLPEKRILYPRGGKTQRTEWPFFVTWEMWMTKVACRRRGEERETRESVGQNAWCKNSRGKKPPEDSKGLKGEAGQGEKADEEEFLQKKSFKGKGN